MNFHDWASQTYRNQTLREAVEQQLANFNPQKYHKAIYKADSFLAHETVLGLATGRLNGLGNALLVITSERVAILQNSFQKQSNLYLSKESLQQAQLSRSLLAGHQLAIGGHRLSRVPKAMAETLRAFLG